VTRRALAVLHALIMISSSMSEVLGLTGCPFWSYDTHDVLIMYTSCSRTDSCMRTCSSPASFFDTLDWPSGTPSLGSASAHLPPAYQLCELRVARACGQIRAPTTKHLDVRERAHRRKQWRPTTAALFRRRAYFPHTPSARQRRPAPWRRSQRLRSLYSATTVQVGIGRRREWHAQYGTQAEEPMAWPWRRGTWADHWQGRWLRGAHGRGHARRGHDHHAHGLPVRAARHPCACPSAAAHRPQGECQEGAHPAVSSTACCYRGSIACPARRDRCPAPSFLPP